MVRSTQQKRLIYNIVQESCDHPTADMVYERARLAMPNISLGTVYRNLASLASCGEILRIPSIVDRFDKTTERHAHFICTECGAVTDLFDYERELTRGMLEDGFLVGSGQVVLTGLCPQCNKNNIQGE